MSIPLVFGWGKKSVEVGYIGINQCPICNQIVHFSINDISNNIRVYFVPIAKL
jgi:transcription elongation factor Elf1